MFFYIRNKSYIDYWKDYIISLRDNNERNENKDSDKYISLFISKIMLDNLEEKDFKSIVYEYEGIISPAYYVYKFISNDFNLRYFHYLIRNKSYTPEFRRLSGGIREGQWDLSRYSLENILILIPPIKEQKEIVEFLDIKCNLIDSFIKEKEQLIDKLEEYKRSLIFEYVTGKKEVPK